MSVQLKRLVFGNTQNHDYSDFLWFVPLFSVLELGGQCFWYATK